MQSSYPNILLKNTRGAATNFYCKYFLSLLSEVVLREKFHFAIDQFTIVSSVTWPPHDSEARVDVNAAS